MENLVEPIKSKEDIRKIEEYLAEQSLRNQLIFVIGINVGLRVSDILGLNISDVKDREYVEIHEQKTGKYKRFPLNPKLKKLIKKYLKEERSEAYSIRHEDDDILFVGKKHCRLDRAQVYRFLNEACENLGIKANVGTHTMRKTFGYHFYKKFNNIVLLQKILNHSDPAITLRYVGIDQEEKDKAYLNFVL